MLWTRSAEPSLLDRGKRKWLFLPLLTALYSGFAFRLDRYVDLADKAQRSAIHSAIGTLSLLRTKNDARLYLSTGDDAISVYCDARRGSVDCAKPRLLPYGAVVQYFEYNHKNIIISIRARSGGYIASPSDMLSHRRAEVTYYERSTFSSNFLIGLLGGAAIMLVAEALARIANYLASKVSRPD